MCIHLATNCAEALPTWDPSIRGQQAMATALCKCGLFVSHDASTNIAEVQDGAALGTLWSAFAIHFAAPGAPSGQKCSQGFEGTWQGKT